MNLLQNLTLGTHRQAPTQAVTDYLELRDAVDPTADDAEKALAAYALTERLERLKIRTVTPPEMSGAIPEDRAAAPAKLSRALKLVFDETYAAVLPEAVRVLNERKLLFPPHLLPGLLDYATRVSGENPVASQAALAAGGHRAAWLAAQHPDWRALTADYDIADAWQQAVTPALQSDLLEQWRRADPETARLALDNIWKDQSPKNQETLIEALAVNLSDADLPWLRQQLKPKRKGVRRAILRLLTLGGEERATEDLINVAAASLTDAGGFVNILKVPEAKEIIKAYGGLKARETLGEFLLGQLPPATLPDLLGVSPEEYWPNLSKLELKAAARAILRYQHVPIQRAFLAYALIARQERLPLPQLAGITAGLPQDDFEAVYHAFMERERDGFRAGGIANLLAVTRGEPWSERISKGYVLALVGKIRDSQGMAYGASREQSELWKRATPLLHVNTFAFLRQHLHSVTERPDTFGKLALSMLQTTAFRRVLYDS